MKRFLCLLSVFILLLPCCALAKSEDGLYSSKFFTIQYIEGYQKINYMDEICLVKGIGGDNTVVVVSEIDLTSVGYTFSKIKNQYDELFKGYFMYLPVSYMKTVKTIKYSNYTVQIRKVVIDETRYYAMIPGKGAALVLALQTDSQKPVDEFKALIDCVKPILK